MSAVRRRGLLFQNPLLAALRPVFANSEAHGKAPRVSFLPSKRILHPGSRGWLLYPVVSHCPGPSAQKPTLTATRGCQGLLQPPCPTPHPRLDHTGSRPEWCCVRPQNRSSTKGSCRTEQHTGPFPCHTYQGLHKYISKGGQNGL